MVNTSPSSFFRRFAAHLRYWLSGRFPLICLASPPAPLGWNQPDFVPDTSWQTSSEVWWMFWAAPDWAPLPGACRPIGLWDGEDKSELGYHVYLPVILKR